MYILTVKQNITTMIYMIHKNFPSVTLQQAKTMSIDTILWYMDYLKFESNPKEYMKDNWEKVVTENNIFSHLKTGIWLD